jgi:hypothetical protein
MRFADSPELEDIQMNKLPLLALFGIVISWTFMPVHAFTAELKTKTLKAFDTYVADVDNLMKKRIDGTISLNSEEDQSEYKSVHEGKIIVKRIKTSRANAPGGMIHEWTGKVFLPEATLQAVSNLLLDYDRHKDIYPEVLQSKLMNAQDGMIHGYLQIKKKTSVITVVLNTEHETFLIDAGNGRIQIRSKSTSISEIKDFGKPHEQVLPSGKDSGFLWRLNSYWNLKQEPGGILAELTVVSLSRDVPGPLFWVKPFLNSVPKEGIESTLKWTRKTILDQ